MPVDKFGRMSDTKTRDTGVLLTYINNNYIRSDGTTPVFGSIDMRGNTLYNVSDPVNPQDVATKEYTDNIRGVKWVKRKQDGTYAIKKDLDMNNKRLTNIPSPVDDADAVNKIYSDTLSDETKRYVNSVTPFVNQQNQCVHPHAFALTYLRTCPRLPHPHAFAPPRFCAYVLMRLSTPSTPPRFCTPTLLSPYVLTRFYAPARVVRKTSRQPYAPPRFCAYACVRPHTFKPRVLTRFYAPACVVL